MSIVTAEEAHRAWLVAEKIKRLADRVVGLGPFSIGLDGFLAPVPIAGTLFSLVAGAWLLIEGFRAGASSFTLARMGFYIGFRTMASIVPIEGWLVDILFRGHMLAANALQRDIEKRFGPPASADVRRSRRNPLSPLAPLGEPIRAT